jgi:ppGpp synthetase/RelA/SpoT-type nucleotidyltranferase
MASYSDRDVRCFHCVTASFHQDVLQVARSISPRESRVKCDRSARTTPDHSGFRAFQMIVAGTIFWRSGA